MLSLPFFQAYAQLAKFKHRDERTAGSKKINYDSLKRAAHQANPNTPNGFQTLKEFTFAYTYERKRKDSIISNLFVPKALKSQEVETRCLANFYTAAHLFFAYQTNESLPYLDSALYLAKANQLTYLLGRAYMLKALHFGNENKIDSALELYVQALDCFNKTNDLIMIGNTYNAIGIVYGTKGLEKETRWYYYKAIEYFQKAKYFEKEYFMKNNLADLYIRNQKPDSALLVFKDFDKVAAEGKVPEKTYYYSQITLAEAFAEVGDLKRALKAIIIAYEFFEKDQSPNALNETIYIRGKILGKLKQYPEAIIYLRRALLIAKAGGVLSRAASIQGTLSECFEAINKHDSALFYLQESNKVTDKIRNEATLAANEEFDKKLKLADSQHELSLEKQKNDFLERDLEKSQLIQLLVVVLAISLLIGLGLSILFLRRISLKNDTLGKQKELLESTKNALEIAVKTKDKLFALIAHDLRGPIGGLSSLPTLLRSIKAPDGSLMIEPEHLADAVEKSVSPVYKLMEDLLIWAQANQDALKVEIKEQEIFPLLKELNDIYQPMAAQKNIQLIIPLEVPSPSAVFDKDTLFTILRNLTGNALKFTPSEGQVSLTLQTSEDTLTLRIKDSGKGMPQEVIDNLTFVQMNHTTLGTAGEKGSGMGLMLVTELARLNGIQVTINSLTGLGTEVILAIKTKA